jgi:hypothetical protein
MKKYLFVFSFSISIFVSEIQYTQTQRNPVLEEETGTWCTYCPCGHTIMVSILQQMPNAVMIGYHYGNDPFANFPGNNVLNLLGFSYLPSAVIDRTGAPIDRSQWSTVMNQRYSVPATVGITVTGGYSPATRVISLSVNSTAIDNLTGNYNMSAILLENGIIALQQGNTQCPGATNYVHKHVVRAMMNGATGQDLNAGNPWNSGQTIIKELVYTIPDGIIADSCDIAIFVYKVQSQLNQSEIQQGGKWKLIDIIPVELTSFNSKINDDGVEITWQTASETNNFAFELQKSLDGKNYFNLTTIPGSGTTTELHEYSYFDRITERTYQKIYYRLRQIDLDGTFYTSNSICVLFDLPSQFDLFQNSPNPFNPTTSIRYAVSNKIFVSLKVYDVLGKEIKTLVSEDKFPGTYEVSFDGQTLASGIYICTLTAGEFSASKKLVLVK